MMTEVLLTLGNKTTCCKNPLSKTYTQADSVLHLMEILQVSAGTLCESDIKPFDYTSTLTMSSVLLIVFISNPLTANLVL